MPEGHDHVVTCDPTFLRGDGVDGGLHWVFAQGFKHRAEGLEVCMCEAVRKEVIVHLRQGLERFLQKNRLGIEACRGWIDAVVTKVRHILDTRRDFADNQVPGLTTKTPGSSHGNLCIIRF